MAHPGGFASLRESGARTCPGTSSCGLQPSAGASCFARCVNARRRGVKATRVIWLVRPALPQPVAAPKSRNVAMPGLPLPQHCRAHALAALPRSGGRPARRAASPTQHERSLRASPVVHNAPLMQRRVRRRHLRHQVPALGCVRAVLRAGVREAKKTRKRADMGCGCGHGKRTASSHCTTTSFTAPVTASSLFGVAQPCWAKQFCRQPRACEPLSLERAHVAAKAARACCAAPVSSAQSSKAAATSQTSKEPGSEALSSEARRGAAKRALAAGPWRVGARTVARGAAAQTGSSIMA